jgi:hypothetical protein
MLRLPPAASVIDPTSATRPRPSLKLIPIAAAVPAVEKMASSAY